VKGGDIPSTVSSLFDHFYSFTFTEKYNENLHRYRSSFISALMLFKLKSGNLGHFLVTILATLTKQQLWVLNDCAKGVWRGQQVWVNGFTPLSQFRK
jgi:hypothetical protein